MLFSLVNLANAHHPGLPIVVGHLNVCLCVSALPVFIHANAVAQIAAFILGDQEAIALITALVRTPPPPALFSFLHPHAPDQ